MSLPTLTTRSQRTNADLDADTSKIVCNYGFSTLEAVPEASSPEVVHHSGLEIANPRHLPSHSHYVIKPYEKQLAEVENTNAPQRFWSRWSRWKRFLIISGVVTLLLIALIIILVLFLKKKSTPIDSTTNNNDNNDNPSTLNPQPNTTTTTSEAQIFCPNSGPAQQIRRQVLSFSYLPSLGPILFARLADSSISSFSLTSQKWTALPTPPASSSPVFLSPPTSIAWSLSLKSSSPPTQISLFSVSSQNSNVFTTTFSSFTSIPDWSNLGASSASPVSLCSVPLTRFRPGEAERIDQWIIDSASRDVLHNFWVYREQKYMENWDVKLLTGNLLSARSAPGVVCWAENPSHVVMVYANATDTLRMRYFNEGGGALGWTGWVDMGGRWKGDPAAVDIEQGRFMFLGVGWDDRVYGLEWRNESFVGTGAGAGAGTGNVNGYRPGFTELSAAGNEGEKVSSVPSGVALDVKGKKEVHVVARGMDGNLKHKVYKNNNWQDGWEDLGVRSKSAPLVFEYQDDEGKSMTGAAMIDDDDKLKYATWETTDDSSWKGRIKWVDGGGSVSSLSMCI